MVNTYVSRQVNTYVSAFCLASFLLAVCPGLFADHNELARYHHQPGQFKPAAVVQPGTLATAPQAQDYPVSNGITPQHHAHHDQLGGAAGAHSQNAHACALVKLAGQ